MSCGAMLVQCATLSHLHTTKIMLHATSPKSSTVKPIIRHRVYCRCVCSPTYEPYVSVCYWLFKPEFNHYREPRRVPMLQLISLSFFIHEQLDELYSHSSFT